jgi:hypothetical protein
LPAVDITGADVKLRVALACSLAMLVARQAQGQADATWRQHLQAAAAALNAGDSAAYRSRLVLAYRAVGATPLLLSRMARAAFAAHDTAAATQWTVALAAMGLPFDTVLGTAYAMMHGNAAVAVLRRTNDAARREVDGSHVAFALAEPDLLVEDLRYDAPRHRFLVSSVHRGGIYAIDATGRVSTVIPPRTDGAWGMYAVGIDERRRSLWVTTIALPGAAGYVRDDSARSALLEYDLVDGTLRRRLVPADSGGHALGDLTVAPDGTVYVSDGLGGGVYALDPGAASLRALLPTGTFSSPQTPALSPDGRRLFVPDYSAGIAVVDLRTARWHWLAHSDSLALTGIDGLCEVGGDLVAVQNGLTPNRIMRLRVDANDRVVRATALVRGSQATDLNHALSIGHRLYFIARSGWDRMTDDGQFTPGTNRDVAQLRRISF